MNQKRTGKFIAELRKNKNMTQGMLAEKIGVSINAVSKWERGLSFPDVSLYKSLCDELEISVEELINGERGHTDSSSINEESIKEKIIRRKQMIEIIFFVVFSFLVVTGIIVFKSLSDKHDDNISDFYERNYQLTLVGRNVEAFLKYRYDGKFPDYYGGMYISDDSNNLVVQIVEDKMPKSGTRDYSYYNELLTTVSDSIKIEYVKNSYNDLEYVFNFISDYMTNNEMPEEFNALFIDIMENMVVVNYREIDENDKKEFREKIIDSDLIKFERALDNVDDSKKCVNYPDELGDKLLETHGDLLINIEIESMDFIPVSLSVYDDGTYELYTAYQECEPGRMCTMMLKYTKSVKGTYNYDIQKIIEEVSNSERFMGHSSNNSYRYEIGLGEKYIEVYDTLTFSVERGINSFYLDEFLHSINVDLTKCAKPEYE